MRHQGVVQRAAIKADYMRDTKGILAPYHIGDKFTKQATIDEYENEAWIRADKIRENKGYPEAKCPTCGCTFHKSRVMKFCGKSQCKWQRAKAAKKARGSKPFQGYGPGTCEICGKTFERKTGNAKTCSYECRYTLANRNAREREKKINRLKAEERDRPKVLLNENQPIFIEERIAFTNPQCTPLENWWAISWEEYHDGLLQRSNEERVLFEDSVESQAFI